MRQRVEHIQISSVTKYIPRERLLHVCEEVEMTLPRHPPGRPTPRSSGDGHVLTGLCDRGGPRRARGAGAGP